PLRGHPPVGMGDRPRQRQAEVKACGPTKKHHLMPLSRAVGASSSPATQPSFHRGRTPANAGRRNPAEVLTPVEVQMLLQAGCGPGLVACRNTARITILYRGGLRISEALSLQPKD